MKRFWSTPEYSRQQRIRRRKAEQRRRTSTAKRLRRARQPPFRIASTDEFVVLTPPGELSVVERPDDTLRFCDQLRTNLRRRQSRVALDFKDVTRISSDALLLIRAIIEEARGIYQSVGGSLPTDANVAAKIKQSGFFIGFTNPPEDLPPPRGLIVRKSRRKVDSEVAAELVEFALAHARFSRGIAEASYKNLVELMGNTHNHAGKRGSKAGVGRQMWQATVYCENDVAYLTFLDLGVGILHSPAPRGLLRRVGSSLIDYGQTKLLKEIFQGIIGASSEVPGRGFGLQRMMAFADDDLLPELRVVTSSVTGEVSGMKFRSIEAHLRGTLFRWTTATASSE